MQASRSLRLVLAGACALAALAGASSARAAETRHDVETDHLDAFDDGGPRSFGVLVNPLATVLGTFGLEGDFVLGDAAALSVEGDWVSTSGTTGYAATVGLPIFPWRVIFHGFYVHPRATAAMVTSAGQSFDVLGIGATAGWQHTWRFGLTLRGGGGVSYDHVLGPEAGSVAILGVRPMLDGQVGWVF
jgi:hypothetical protein